MASRIFNLETTTGEWSASRPGRFSQGKEHPVEMQREVCVCRVYPFDERQNGPQNQSGLCGEESHPVIKLQFPGCLGPSLVTILTGNNGNILVSKVTRNRPDQQPQCRQGHGVCISSPRTKQIWSAPRLANLHGGTKQHEGKGGQ